MRKMNKLSGSRYSAQLREVSRSASKAPGARSHEHQLEQAIGHEVRTLRKKHGMTVTELAATAELSPGMLSKIENGLTSPSLSTLQALGNALNVSVMALMRRHEQRHEATFVPAGQGLHIKRRGTRSGHDYQLLGHAVSNRVGVEPYHITLDKKSEVYPSFQHEGTEFIHVISGRMVYRHGLDTFDMMPGDSLFFDAQAPHGPEELLDTPIKFLCIIAYESAEDNND
ncbi:MAG: MerR family transcriptional regulator [Rhodospirillaceae bacterium]|nr:MerR family transcriptional regulator [Rhodospirillaceae bacterium]